MSCVGLFISVVLSAASLLAGAEQGAATRSTDPPTIDCAFPGGNILVDRIDGDTVHLRQDLRDTEGWWFYWCFRVGGVAGRRMTFRFAGRSPIGLTGPAVSVDGGTSWSWLGSGAVDGPSFTYPFPADAGEVRFCFAMPYQESDLRRFLLRHPENPCLSVATLCKTRKGRVVERIHAGRLDGEPKYRVLLTCRHHACESMASYALEGVLEEVVAGTDDGSWLRRNVEVLAVPFMDKDGVEAGDQGKNRRPRDHNRDYAGESLYPSVRALRELVPRWSQGRLRLAMDLHCPYIRGDQSERLYQVGQKAPGVWAQQRAFGRILEETRVGPIPYRAENDLPFGVSWNTEKNYGAGKCCGSWARELPGIRLATVLEIPYAKAGGQTVTAETARALGRDLARAIRKHLECLDQSRNGGDEGNHDR
ncbi:MAG: peptidase M14 [Phycisphaerae bacterium]|nr:peptidase M14 [Phycisphaerae bacterium]